MDQRRPFFAQNTLVKYALPHSRTAEHTIYSYVSVCGCLSVCECVSIFRFGFVFCHFLGFFVTFISFYLRFISFVQHFWSIEAQHFVYEAVVFSIYLYRYIEILVSTIATQMSTNKYIWLKANAKLSKIQPLNSHKRAMGSFLLKSSLAPSLPLSRSIIIPNHTGTYTHRLHTKIMVTIRICDKCIVCMCGNWQTELFRWIVRRWKGHLKLCQFDQIESYHERKIGAND